MTTRFTQPWLGPHLPWFGQPPNYKINSSREWAIVSPTIFTPCSSSGEPGGIRKKLHPSGGSFFLLQSELSHFLQKLFRLSLFFILQNSRQPLAPVPQTGSLRQRVSEVRKNREVHRPSGFFYLKNRPTRIIDYFAESLKKKTL